MKSMFFGVGLFARIKIMKRILLIFLFALILPISSVNAADEDWVVNSFDSQISIQQDGIVAVKETILVDFLDLQKHGIYRYVPFKYSNSDGTYTYTEISDIQITRNSVSETFDKSSARGNITLKIGNAYQTISGIQEYQINYKVKGVLLPYDKYDELYWNVTGNDWPVVIKAVSATVSLPADGIVQSSCYFGEYKSTSTCKQVESTSRSASFSDNNIQSGANMTVAVGYTKDMVPIITLKDPTELTLAGSIAMVVGMLVVIIFGLVFLFIRWWKNGRDRRFIKIPSGGIGGKEEAIPIGFRDTISPEFSPPKGYRPAEIGVVIDEKVDTVDITATIVDLAIRGYLTITEIPKTNIFTKVDYRLKKINKNTDDLLDYEKYLFNSLFSLGTNNEVKASELKNKFYTNLNELQDKLYKRVTDTGLFTHDPAMVRKKYLSWGIVLVLAIPGFIGLAIYYLLASVGFLEGLFMGVLIGLIVVGIATLCFVKAMAQRTAKGRELYRKAMGYKLFVTTAEKYRQKFMEDQNIFMEILPYAMIFNVTEKLAKAFKDIDITPPQPTWYYGSGNFNYIVFASSMNSFSSSISSSIASTPGSSGSGGGGFSGGGFGGGGGGSW